MSGIIVFLVFGVSLCLAVLFLYLFRERAWYWHVLSVVLALALGLMPGDLIPANLRSQTTDLVVGFVFLFLMVWGVGGMLLHAPHREKHA